MKRILWLFWILPAVCLSAQTYSRMDFSLQTAQGQAVPGASVTVYNQAACGFPASGVATLYSSTSGGSLSNPLTTDGFGHAYAYVTPACYTVTYFSQFTGTQTFADQTPPGGGGGGGGGGGSYPGVTADGLTPGGLKIAGNVAPCREGQTLYLNTGCYTGGDFGAQLNSAMAACPSSGCTIDTSPLTGNQTAVENIVVSKTNITVKLGAGLSLVFGSGFNWQVLANSFTLNSPGWVQAQISCGTAVACIAVGNATTAVYNTSLDWLSVVANGGTFPIAGMSFENARNTKVTHNYIFGFSGTKAQTGGAYDASGVQALENCWTWQFTDNQMVSNNYDLGVFGDSWNAWKIERNLFNSSNVGLYLSLQSQNGLYSPSFGDGVSGGFVLDASNHCEVVAVACVRFVNGYFYSSNIYGQYDELNTTNIPWTIAQNDGIQNHQLFIVGANYDGGGGYFSNGLAGEPLNILDTTASFAYTSSPLTIASASGSGSVLSITTTAPHGFTCTPSCPDVNINLTGTTPFTAPVYKISGITSSTIFTLAVNTASTYNCSSACGTVNYSSDAINVTIKGQAWRAGFLFPLLAKATGPNINVREFGNYVWDGYGNVALDGNGALNTATGGANISVPLEYTVGTLLPTVPALQITNEVSTTGETTGTQSVDTSLVATAATFGTPVRNQLTTAQATMYPSTTGWVNNGNTTIGTNSSLGSGKMTAIAAGNISIAMGSGSANWVAATPGQNWTGLASLQAATTARDISIDLYAYDNTSTFISRFGSNNYGSFDAVGSWTQIYANGTTPAGTAWVVLIVRVGFNSLPVLGEVHDVYQLSLSQNTSSFWLPPATTHATVDSAGNSSWQSIAINGVTSTAPVCPNGTGGALTTTGCVTTGIGNIQITTATTSVAANSCDASATTATMTGLATTSTITLTPSTDISGVTGWGGGALYFVAWPTSNTLNYKRCNGSAGPITPGSVTWNVSAR